MNIIAFQALLCNTVEGLAVRAISSETKNISFPIYHAVGTVRCNIADGSIFVRCLTGDGSGTSLTLSVYQGAYYGCGIPIKSLIGQKINCVICPLDPSVERSDLQVSLIALWWAIRIRLPKRCFSFIGDLFLPVRIGRCFYRAWPADGNGRSSFRYSSRHNPQVFPRSSVQHQFQRRNHARSA